MAAADRSHLSWPIIRPLTCQLAPLYCHLRWQDGAGPQAHYLLPVRADEIALAKRSDAISTDRLAVDGMRRRTHTLSFSNDRYGQLSSRALETNKIVASATQTTQTDRHTLTHTRTHKPTEWQTKQINLNFGQLTGGALIRQSLGPDLHLHEALRCVGRTPTIIFWRASSIVPIRGGVVRL